MLTFSGVKNVITGTNGNDYLVGNDTAVFEYVDGRLVILPADDAIYGYGGKDSLLGRGGNDDLYGGDEDDNLYGDSGNDRLYGDSGDDYLSGGSGNDYIDGGTGNDRFFGGSGYDTLISGSLGDKDDFFISNSYKGAGYARIKDFDLFGSAYDEIKILSGTNYQLSYEHQGGSGSKIDTVIKDGGDWLAVVEDVEIPFNSKFIDIFFGPAR